MALSDAEKRQARATDPRAADLMDRLEGLVPETLERLHGAIWRLAPAAGTRTRPWWDPGAGSGISRRRKSSRCPRILPRSAHGCLTGSGSDRCLPAKASCLGKQAYLQSASSDTSE
jgi:hypothetical protein